MHMPHALSSAAIVASSTNPRHSSTAVPNCLSISSSDGSLQSGNMEDIYIRYSPYGTWKLQVVDRAAIPLDVVTAIRFEFTLQYKPGRFPGE